MRRRTRRTLTYAALILLAGFAHHARAADPLPSFQKLADTMGRLYAISYMCKGQMDGQPERYVATIEDYWNQVDAEIVPRARADGEAMFKANPELRRRINHDACEDQLVPALYDYAQAHHLFMLDEKGKAVTPVPPYFLWETAIIKK